MKTKVISINTPIIPLHLKTNMVLSIAIALFGTYEIWASTPEATKLPSIFGEHDLAVGLLSIASAIILTAKNITDINFFFPDND